MGVYPSQLRDQQRSRRGGGPESYSRLWRLRSAVRPLYPYSQTRRGYITALVLIRPLDSRSQQRRYGHIRSAPSFVDVTSSPDENEQEDGQWGDDSPPLQPDDQAAEDGESGLTGHNPRRGSPGSPNLFPSDPFRFSPNDHDARDGHPEYFTASPTHREPVNVHKPTTERTPLLHQPGSTARRESRALEFAPDGIGVEAGHERSRRRSSVGRKKRARDVGESTNGQTVCSA